MIKKILLLVLLVAPMSLAAQMKFASFDYSAIMQAMPETKQAQTELETMGKQFSDELQSMQPENIRTRRAQEIQDLQTRYEQAANDNQQAFEEARTKKLQPIMQKVLDAVNSVAKEGNYVYVDDKNASQTAGIIINEALSEDVTVKVLSKLGLSASALTTSSAATGTTN